MAATATSGTAVVTLPWITEHPHDLREFNAPRHLVYRAWTSPDLIKRWWAGDRGVVTVVEIDLRVGGSFRYAMDANPGFEVAFHGEFREIVPNQRIVSTEIVRGHAGTPGPQCTPLTFTEEDGRTTLTILTRYPEPARSATWSSPPEWKAALQESLERPRRGRRSH